MKKIKVAIVDDHKILREGLRLMISEMDNAEVIIEAANGKDFIEKIADAIPDLAIVDINMPLMGGEETVKLSKQILPSLKILILSMHSDEQYYNAFNKLGVDGYVLKEADYNELDIAIKTIMNGGQFFSQQLLRGLLKNRPKQGSNTLLTDREKEVLKLLCAGYSTNEIADKLCVSTRTIEKHRSEMLYKTDSSNSISLVIHAIKNGFVEI
jgi:DNA-binding NarL/FixJ family response regulator